jgi:polyphosphate kinase
MPEAQPATPEPVHLNRELSWLNFNARVLHEALDSRTPLLERVKFLDIFHSNLDEFFMKRVGGLKRQVIAGLASNQNELSPRSQLARIRAAILPQIQTHAKCFKDEIRPALTAQNIHLVSWADLAPQELEQAKAFFARNLFPVLTPLAVDPGHPFPFISNLSVSIGLLLKHPDRPDEPLFARIKVPDVFPAWLRLNPTEAASPRIRMIHLHDIIRENLHSLFPGLEIFEHLFFRITRNADLERDEEDAEDLLEMIAQELRERRFAQVVRLEHGPNPSHKILQFLCEELDLEEADIYELPLPLGEYQLKPLTSIERGDLKATPWVPVVPLSLSDDEKNFFSILREGDLLVHHPYESFKASVERFIRSAVEDPKVIAIKMTLYRTGEDSPFIPLLIRAAERGKQVVCLVELKARFDEERNILVARALEDAGVHVVYGIVGLKTHCKVALVVRTEPEGVRCYAHIGTGNYHMQTANLYTDLGFFTSKPDLTDDVVHLFHYLTGRSLYRHFRKLLVAPVDMKESFLRLIEREIHHFKSGKPAHIVGKMNSLEDKQICSALYAAAAAGVEIDLIVRGICCLCPPSEGPGFQKIRVRSIVGRFLEHSRLFYFRNAAAQPVDGEFFIGSADWMQRNLNSRVEAVVPIEDRPLREKCWDILTALLQDDRQAWVMDTEGQYSQRQPQNSEQPLGTHALLMRHTVERENPVRAGTQGLLG